MGITFNPKYTPRAVKLLQDLDDQTGMGARGNEERIDIIQAALNAEHEESWEEGWRDGRGAKLI